MSAPTEREWLEGIGEQFEREHERGRVTVRVEVVTPCEHNEWNPHRSGDGEITASSDGAEIMAVICRGASRKAFTEWPPEAIEAAARRLCAYNHNKKEAPCKACKWGAELTMEALWDHVTGDNK